MATQTNSTAPKRPKWVKWLVILGALVVIYTIAGFFILPAIIKSQMLKRIPALTHRHASIESVKVNPYALSLTLNNFSLKDLDGETFVAFDRVYVNFQLSSILKRCWVFDEVSVDAPFIQVSYLTNGTFNFSDLLANLGTAAPASTPAPKKSSAPPPVLVYHLIITNGAVAFTDQTRDTPFKTRYQPINIDLSGLTTIHDADSPYFFSVRGDTGESFAWKGRVTVNPLHADGSFRLDGFKLAKYMPYGRDFTRLEIVDGQIGVSADYRYDSATNALDLTVSKASVELSNLRIKTPDTGEEVISIPSLSIQGIDAAVARMTAHVALVKSTGGAIQVRRNADGGINLLSYLVDPTKAKQATRAVPTTTPAALPPLSIKVDEVAFDNYSVKAEDRVPPKPASINLDQIAFDIKGITLASNAPITLSAGVRIQETGTVGVNGSATLMPPSADLQIGVTNLDLRVGQPYVEQQAKVAITRGALNVNGHARYPGGDSGSPMATFEGDVSIADFACADEIQFKDLAHWKDLSIDGIKLAVQPDKVQVDQIKLSGFGANLILDTNRQPVILAVLPRKPAGNTPTNEAIVASTAPAKTVPDISVGAVVLENASVGFADQSIEPHCTFTIQEFSGAIKELSSKDQTTASVDVKGNVDAQSPFTVSGRVNPLASKLFADIAVTFTNTSLISFTPYTEKFAGRPLQKGKLSFGVHYLVNDKDLKAENGFFVDQLTLGPKNNSPDATHLPVKLAIALLKDRSGRIKLDIPVQGRIDDPKFALAPIIWQVIENLMIKAAASPFTLLGSMFGGGEEMSFVDFDPGQSTIPTGETNKLDKLSKALYERPEVTVEITGSVDPAKDRDTLAHAKFEQRLKAMLIKEITDAGKPASNIDEIKLDPADYTRLTTQAYTNDFGPLTNTFSTSVTGTNATPASVTSASKPAVVASQPPIGEPAAPDVPRGGSRLMAMSHPVFVPAASGHSLPATAPAATNSVPAVTAPAPPPGPDDLAAMEQKLIEKIVVTDDDLRQLMQDRAAQVQGYLLKTGKVTPERLFLIAPRPMTADSKGEDKVNLSLN